MPDDIRDEIRKRMNGGSDIDPDLTGRDLAFRKHSYRGFQPEEFLVAWENATDKTGEERLDAESTVRSAMGRMEGGRWEGFMESASTFFSKLDRDEMELFTRRNPDLVEWVSAWHTVNELRPYRDMRELARESLSPGRERAVNPPPFERGEIPSGETLFSHLKTKRRSYRNWTPQEITDLYQQMRDGEISVVDPRSADIEARKIYERVEGGRMEDLADETLLVFSRLDLDERRMFARRNPGIVMWMSAFGRMNGLIHGDQLQVDFPTLPERSA